LYRHEAREEEWAKVGRGQTSTKRYYSERFWILWAGGEGESPDGVIGNSGLFTAQETLCSREFLIMKYSTFKIGIKERQDRDSDICDCEEKGLRGGKAVYFGGTRNSGGICGLHLQLDVSVCWFLHWLTFRP
jgi:hypothetical protein